MKSLNFFFTLSWEPRHVHLSESLLWNDWIKITLNFNCLRYSFESTSSIDNTTSPSLYNRIVISTFSYVFHFNSTGIFICKLKIFPRDFKIIFMGFFFYSNLSVDFLTELPLKINLKIVIHLLQKKYFCGIEFWKLWLKFQQIFPTAVTMVSRKFTVHKWKFPTS